MIRAGCGGQNNERRNKARTPDKGLLIVKKLSLFTLGLYVFYHLYSWQEGLQRVKEDIKRGDIGLKTKPLRSFLRSGRGEKLLSCARANIFPPPRQTGDAERDEAGG